MGAPLPQPWTGHREVIPVDVAFVEAIRRGAAVEFSTAPAADAPRMRGRLVASPVGPDYHWTEFDAQGRETGRREVWTEEVEDLVHTLVAPELIGEEPALDSIGSLERVRLASRLSAAVAKLQAIPRDGGPAQSLARAAAAGEVVALVKRLGGGRLPSESELLLADIAAGRHDSQGLAELLDLLATHVWNEARDGMTAESERVAHEAITHWAKLEEAANG